MNVLCRFSIPEPRDSGAGSIIVLVALVLVGIGLYGIISTVVRMLRPGACKTAYLSSLLLQGGVLLIPVVLALGLVGKPGCGGLLGALIFFMVQSLTSIVLAIMALARIRRRPDTYKTGKGVAVGTLVWGGLIFTGLLGLLVYVIVQSPKMDWD